jgi:hypothetical protein
MRSVPLIEANLQRRYIAPHEVHSGSKTNAIPQTVYDDDNDYNDYDDLSAQGLWTIEAAIDRSSAYDPTSLSD